ncbi:hypothetical protein ADUPG1_011945, partial [Aduncisulcus paluster]
SLKNICERLPASIDELETLKQTLRSIPLPTLGKTEVESLVEVVKNDFVPLLWDISEHLKPEHLPPRLSFEEQQHQLEAVSQASSSVKILKRPQEVRGLIFIISDVVMNHPYFRLSRDLNEYAIRTYLIQQFKRDVYLEADLPQNEPEREKVALLRISEKVRNHFVQNPVHGPTIKLILFEDLLCRGIEKYKLDLLIKNFPHSDLMAYCISKVIKTALRFSKHIISKFFKPLCELFIMHNSFPDDFDSKKLTQFRNFAIFCLGAVDRWELAESTLLSDVLLRISEEFEDHSEDIMKLDTHRLKCLLIIFTRVGYAIGPRMEVVAESIKSNLVLNAEELLTSASLIDSLKKIMEPFLIIIDHALEQWGKKKTHVQVEIDGFLGRVKSETGDRIEMRKRSDLSLEERTALRKKFREAKSIKFVIFDLLTAQRCIQSLTSETPFLTFSRCISTFYQNTRGERPNSIWCSLNSASEAGWYLCAYEGLQSMITWEKSFAMKRRSFGSDLQSDFRSKRKSWGKEEE